VRLNRIRRESAGTPFVRTKPFSESRSARGWIYFTVQTIHYWGGVTGTEAVTALSGLTDDQTKFEPLSGHQFGLLRIRLPGSYERIGSPCGHADCHRDCKCLQEAHHGLVVIPHSDLWGDPSTIKARSPIRCDPYDPHEREVAIAEMWPSRGWN